MIREKMCKKQKPDRLLLTFVHALHTTLQGLRMKFFDVRKLHRNKEIHFLESV